jgi:hypothetical protein
VKFPVASILERDAQVLVKVLEFPEGELKRLRRSEPGACRAEGVPDFLSVAQFRFHGFNLPALFGFVYSELADFRIYFLGMA